MQSFLAGVAHDLPQVKIQRLFKIAPGSIVIPILGGKEGVTGKAEGGIVQALGFKILPGVFLLFPGEPIWQTGHQQKGVRLFDDLIALQAVETDLVIAGLVPLFERRRVHRFQQMEGVVRPQPPGGRVARHGDGLPQFPPAFGLLFREA